MTYLGGGQSGDQGDTFCVGHFHTFVQKIRVFTCFFAFGWRGVHGEGGKGDRVNPLPPAGSGKTFDRASKDFRVILETCWVIP